MSLISLDQLLCKDHNYKNCCIRTRILRKLGVPYTNTQYLGCSSTSNSTRLQDRLRCQYNTTKLLPLREGLGLYCSPELRKESLKCQALHIWRNTTQSLTFLKQPHNKDNFSLGFVFVKNVFPLYRARSFNNRNWANEGGSGVTYF